MIQQKLKAGFCQISVEYLKMYRDVCTMYIHICKFLSMYMKWTGITYLYRHVCTITYLYVHGIIMYIPCIYRFYIPVQGQKCLYMVQTCLYRFAKSCPGGQDSRCIHGPAIAAKVLWTPDGVCTVFLADTPPKQASSTPHRSATRTLGSGLFSPKFIPVMHCRKNPAESVQHIQSRW